MKKIILVLFLFCFAFATSAPLLAQDNNDQDSDNPLLKFLDKVKKKAKELIDGIKKKFEEFMKDGLGKEKSKPKPEATPEAIPEPQPVPEPQTLPDNENPNSDGKPYVGFRALQLNKDSRQLLGLNPDEGLLVKVVYADSPATDVLKVGDVILTADGQKLSKIKDLSAIMKTKKPGDTIIFTGLRDFEEFQVTIKLAKKPTELPKMQPEPKVEPKPEVKPEVVPEPKPEPKVEPKIHPKNLDELLEKFFQDGDVKDPEPSKGLLESLGNSGEFAEKLKDLFKDPGKMRELMDQFMNPDKDKKEVPTEPAKRKIKLGLRADNATPQMLMKGQFGLLITKVYDATPAAEAGFQVNDILTQFAGVEITNKADLADVLKGLEPGDIVEALVIRDGKEVKLTIKF